MTINPRRVDERDSQWELDRLDLRAFIYRADGVHDVVDVDQTTLATVESWIRQEAPAGSQYAVALRTLDAQGRLGLIWLVREPEDAPDPAMGAVTLNVFFEPR